MAQEDFASTSNDARATNSTSEQGSDETKRGAPESGSGRTRSDCGGTDASGRDVNRASFEKASEVELGGGQAGKADFSSSEGSGKNCTSEKGSGKTGSDAHVSGLGPGHGGCGKPDSSGRDVKSDSFETSSGAQLAGGQEPRA